jgi:hypothetical protein
MIAEFSFLATRARRFRSKLKLLLLKFRSKLVNNSINETFGLLSHEFLSSITSVDGTVSTAGLRYVAMAASYLYCTTKDASEDYLENEVLRLFKIFREHENIREFLKGAYIDFFSLKDIDASSESSTHMKVAAKFVCNLVQKFLFFPAAAKPPTFFPPLHLIPRNSTSYSTVVPSKLGHHDSADADAIALSNEPVVKYIWPCEYFSSVPLLHSAALTVSTNIGKRTFDDMISKSSSKEEKLRAEIHSLRQNQTELKKTIESKIDECRAIVKKEREKKKSKDSKHKAKLIKLEAIKQEKELREKEKENVKILKDQERQKREMERKLMREEERFKREEDRKEKLAEKSKENAKLPSFEDEAIKEEKAENLEGKGRKDRSKAASANVDVVIKKTKIEVPHYLSILSDLSGGGYYSLQSALHDPSRRIGIDSALNVIVPLRGWKYEEIGIDSENVSDHAWFDPRICAFCKLGEDDYVDCININLSPTCTDVEGMLTAQSLESDSIQNVKSNDDLLTLSQLETSESVQHNSQSVDLEYEPEILESSDERSAFYFYCLELKSKHNCEFSEEELTSRWKHLSEEDRRPYDELFAQAANSTIVQESVSLSVENLESGTSRKRERVRSSRFLEFEDLDFLDKKKPRMSNSQAAGSNSRQESKKNIKEEYDSKNLIKSSDIYGRMIPLPDGNSGHINCVRWCSDVVERSGYLSNAAELKNFSHLSRICAVCGQRRACIACEHSSCRKFFHLGCALSVGCKFSEARLSNESDSIYHEVYTFVHCPAHAESRLAKPFELTHIWKPSNPTRLMSVLDNVDDVDSNIFSEENGFIIGQQIAISRRLISSSFGLSFPSKLSQRAVRSGGICGSGVGFRGTARLFSLLANGQGKPCRFSDVHSIYHNFYVP